VGPRERSDLGILGLLLAVALVLALLVLTFGGPVVHELASLFNEGVGLKAAAIWSFFVTVALFVLFALVAGDSLIGELQFMFGAFFSFFALIWLLIAWVF
jgi:hypothetical protein